jgi:hypothetical protein
VSNIVDLRVPEKSKTQEFKPLDEAIWRAWVEKNDLQDKRRAAARIKAVTWASIAVLMATAVVSSYIFAPYVSTYQAVVRSVVAIGAIVIMFESLRARQYAFTAPFAGIILVFNPVLPAFAFSGNGLILFASVLPFVASLVWMKERPRRVAVHRSALV